MISSLHLRHFSVSAAVAGGDKVCHPAGLEVGGVIAPGVEGVSILDHLLQPEPIIKIVITIVIISLLMT